MLAELRGLIEIPLAKRRASAALTALEQVDFVAGALEDFDRGNADIGFMIADERVVPKNDAATRR